MKVLLAIVLYRCKFNDSSTINSITKYLDKHCAVNEYCINIYDNSEESQVINDSRFCYCSNSKNYYLAYNYNRALDFCINNNIEWMVLLDQDSILSDEYLNIIFNKQLEKESICYVPNIFSHNGNCIAPYTISLGFRKRYSLSDKSKLYSINSGTVINVELFYNKIGVFTNKYPLDFLDHWYFHKINRLNGKIEVLPVRILHDLSVSNISTPVSLERYKSILKSERTFFYNELGIFDRVLYKFNLLRRYFIWVKRKKNAYAKLVLKCFWGRLL
jgi:hypothetical protein